MYVIMFQNSLLPKLLVCLMLTAEADVLCLRLCLHVALWGVSVCVCVCGGCGGWRVISIPLASIIVGNMFL